MLLLIEWEEPGTILELVVAFYEYILTHWSLRNVAGIKNKIFEHMSRIKFTSILVKLLSMNVT